MSPIEWVAPRSWVLAVAASILIFGLTGSICQAQEEAATADAASRALGLPSLPVPEQLASRVNEGALPRSHGLARLGWKSSRALRSVDERSTSLTATCAPQATSIAAIACPSAPPAPVTIATRLPRSTPATASCPVRVR